MKLIYIVVTALLLTACQIPLQTAKPAVDGNTSADSNATSAESTTGGGIAVTVNNEEGECAAPVIAELAQCTEKLQAAIARQQLTVKTNQPLRHQEKLIIGRVEYVQLNPSQQVLKARIDTGAGLSSLNAVNLVPFQRDGKNWVRFNITDPKTKKIITLEKKIKRYVNIKQLSGDYQRRPIILMGLVLGSIEEQVELSLTDRSGYVYQLLIGRNFLRDRAIVDVSQKFITHPPES